MEIDLSWLATATEWATRGRDLALIAGGAVGLGLAIRNWKLKEKENKRQQEQHAEWERRQRLERYEHRVERFNNAAERVLEWGRRVGDWGLDATLAIREIEGIAEADPRNFGRQAKRIVDTMDRRMRFPSKEDVEEFEKMQTEEREEEAKAEADPDSQWWKQLHRPYEADEPRIGAIDVSFVQEIERLVEKWGQVPKKKGG